MAVADVRMAAAHISTEYDGSGFVVANYQVQVNGENFLIEQDGKQGKFGFFTFRYIEAADPAAAENEAVERIRQTPHLRSLVRNPPDDPPTMVVTEIVELASFDGIDNLEPGLIWYEEKPKRWWEFWKR